MPVVQNTQGAQVTVGGGGAQVQISSQPGSPAQVYRALRSQRSILGDQLDDAQGLRRDIAAQLQQPNLSPATKASLEKRLTVVDARIEELDQQITASDKAVAEAAAVPGATVPPPAPRSDRPDPDMIAGMTFALMLVVAIPITIAYARRIWRRSARTEVVLPPEMSERLADLERGMEAVAIEVERIGESQRYLTQAMLGRGAAEPARIGRHPEERA